MSTLGATVLTLADWAKRLDPAGKIPAIVELLSQSNTILNDMMFKEGNLPTGDRTIIRTGLPTVAWRLINQGVQPSKSTTAQVDESCGMLEAYSEVDEDLANLNGNANAFRLSEASAFVESMNIEMASTLFYGNSGVAPEEFNGLAIRYSSLSAANAQNIVDGGGTGSDNSSIYLVVWGANTIHGVFPKGSQAGLKHKDLGLQTIHSAGGVIGAKMQAYIDHWQWKCGLVLKDWRAVVRICNIDISALVAGSGNADLTQLLIKAIHRVHNLSAGKAVFYMNRSLIQYLDIQRRDEVIAGGGLTYDTVDGKRVASFRGIPIVSTDALLETEARVV